MDGERGGMESHSCTIVTYRLALHKTLVVKSHQFKHCRPITVFA